MGHLRLCGKESSIVVETALWDDLIEWAEDNGWSPEHDPVLYQSGLGYEVSAQEASNLADAFEVIAGNLILHDSRVSDAFMRDLISSFETLIVFCQSGGFHILQAEGKPKARSSAQ